MSPLKSQRVVLYQSVSLPIIPKPRVARITCVVGIICSPSRVPTGENNLSGVPQQLVGAELSRQHANSHLPDCQGNMHAEPAPVADSSPWLYVVSPLVANISLRQKAISLLLPVHPAASAFSLQGRFRGFPKSHPTWPSCGREGKKAMCDFFYADTYLPQSPT